MKIYVLGNEKSFIANHLSYPKISDRLLPQYEQIKSVLEKYNPDVLINCLGFSGYKNIDDCEIDLKKTFDTNTLIPIILGNICEELHIKFINISSGCIYNKSSYNLKWNKEYYEKYDPIHYLGDSEQYTSHYLIDTGWKEQDPAVPVSSYSKSKYAADLALETLPHTTLLRIRMPISNKAHPRNLISKLISYSQIVETENSVTFLNDLSRVISFVIEKDKYGIFNCTSPIPLKHSQILDEYKKYSPAFKYEQISINELNALTQAKRSNCILDSSKLQDAGFQFYDTYKNLQECMEKFCKSAGS